MKIFKKLALNTEFFNRYISLINNTAIIKTITQVVSAVTAITIWYTLAENNLKPLLGGWAIIPASIFAVVVAVAIEVGLRRFLPYGVRCFIQKRWKGLDGAMSAFILPICFSLLVASGWTSFKGSYAVIETVTPDVELKTTTSTDSVYIAQKLDNKNIFKSDSLIIVSSFNNQISATNKRYEALVTSNLNKSTQYEERAKRAKSRSNKSWLIVLRDRELSNADLQTNKKDSVIADLEAAKAAKLLILLQNRRTDKIVADTIYQAATGKIIASNDVLLAKNKNLIDTYGIGLGWITIICLLVFIALTILEEIHKKGSKIEETIIFSQYDILQPLFTRWTNYINESWLGFWHRKLDKWEDNLTPPKLPKQLPPLYYLGNQEQEHIEVQSNAQTVKDALLIKDTIEEKDNEWNEIIADTFEDIEGFENGFSLNKLDVEPIKKNGSKSYKNDTLIIDINDKKIEPQKRVEIKGFLRYDQSNKKDTNNDIDEGKKLHRLPVLPIYDINKLNKRDKEKFKAKQKLRVQKFYKKYLVKHGKKPSYKVISDALEMTEKTAGNYVRQLKREGIIGK